MRLEFVAQSTRNDGNKAANTGRLVNFYPEPLPAGSLAQFQLRSVLGMTTWTSDLSGVFFRDISEVDGKGYAISGGYLWELEPIGGANTRASIPDADDTQLGSNDGNVTITADGRYFVWDGATLTEPAAGAFSAVGGHDYLGGYTILTEAGGQRFGWSSLLDPLTLPGLNFSYADAKDGDLLRPVAVNGVVMLMGINSIEVWSLTGQANENAFARVGGTVHEIGLKEFGLVAKTQNGAFFIGSDEVVYATDGMALTPISTPAVQYSVMNGDPSNCFYYEDEGHKFAVIRFSDRPAWVYDFATGLWHERATGIDDPWFGRAAAKVFGKWRVGGAGCDIVTMERTNTDHDGHLIRRAVSLPGDGDGQRFRVPEMEILGKVGLSDIGRDAALMLRISRDGGATFPLERTISMGGLGDFYQRMVTRQLGQFRRAVVEVRVSDPSDLTILSRMNMVTA